MMNNFEFIDEYINECERSKKYIKADMKKYKNDVNMRNDMKFYLDEQQLQINQLQQIKSKLKAWEVAKKVLNSFDTELIEGILIGLCDSSEINKNEMQKFKKALEVKDE